MPALLSGLEPAARIVVATLFNNLWEAAVLAAVVAIVLRVLPNVNATTRYAAWCVALVGSLLLPLATALPQIAVQPQGAVVRQTHPDEQQTRHGEIKPGAPAAVSSTHRAAAPAGTAAPSSSFRLPERLHFSLPQYVALAIFAVWCLAALLLLVRLAINLWKLERLKSDALPLPVEYRERLERWARADKGEREVRLCTCEAIEVPVAVGLFDSMILIPKHLLDTLSQSEIDQIILHELAHLRRADDWTNGFQRFIQALFFFNPAVLYIAQQLDLEREVACDDWVVDQTKEVRPYATCLTKMAEATAWPHRPLAAPGVFVTRRGLSVRVERLLRAGRNIRTSVSFGPTGAIVASLIVLFFVLQTVAPSFAFTMNGQSAQHAVTVAAVTVAKEKTPPQKAVVKVKATPKPHVKYVTVPSVNVDVPAQHIDIPAQHIHMHAQRIPIMTPSFPPGFAKHMAQISKNAVDVSTTVSQAMTAALSGKGGKFNCVGCDFSG
ncbi:MAG TPA: M56 family metallopeptidase, partial [Candidatus Baltobacteraceae bacterium]|nr:M56 family metallopeptidase [Candidatus Baltobacteraceae bacterium]